MNPVAPVTKYAMGGGYRLVTSHGQCADYSGLPPNMISSQLGTEARPRVFLTGRRGASGSSSSGSWSDWVSDPARPVATGEQP